MSWSWLDKIANEVTKYSTFIGQLWYVLTFIFRLMVVIGLGSSVYGDEQSNFKCSQAVVGCVNACYNQFTTISHLRFWGFQLLAIVSPVIAFHFMSAYFSGQIEKIKTTEKELNNEDEDAFRSDRHRNYEARKLENRRKIVGKVRSKRIYKDGQLKEIPVTDKIRLAYFVTTVMRLCIEGAFLYLTYRLYNYPNYLCEAVAGGLGKYDNVDCTEVTGKGGLSFLWAIYPEIYPCRSQPNTGVSIACHQHIVFGNSAVPCWTSRAYEKTVFLRYVNILSAICFLLCAMELVYIPVHYAITMSAKRSMPIRIQYHDYPKAGSVQTVESHLPLRGQHSVFSSDYQNRRESEFFGDREMPHHPPPNETTAKRYEESKRYDEFKA